MKILLLLLMPFALFSPDADGRIDISWLDGQWKGLGYQPNSIDNTWTIELNCDAKRKKFVIDYSSLGCGGKWTIVETFENRVIFKEKIQEGKDRCIPTGTVIVTRVNARYISYTFFEERGENLVLSAFSTLEKVD